MEETWIKTITNFKTHSGQSPTQNPQAGQRAVTKLQGDSGIEEISGINRFVVMTKNYKSNQFPSF